MLTRVEQPLGWTRRPLGLPNLEEAAMRSLICASAIVACLTFVAGVRADDNEEKVPLDQLPAKVTAAVNAKFAGADLIGASKEKEDGKEVYEVELKLKGVHYDVTLLPGGDIVLIEKQIKASDLPEAVTKALETKYPKATYKIVEEISKGESKSYEILLVTTDKKKIEAKFDATGKLLEEESKDKKKEEKKEKPV